jgi:hypothetical protein
MLARNNDLYSTGTSAEDQMKINTIRLESEEIYQKNLYKEAARRVVFSNCMSACELDNKQVPNFNREFYYGQPQAQACLSNCFNTRMNLHFGATTVEREGLGLNFDEMKKEYQRYENWHPLTRQIKGMSNEVSNDYVSSVAQSLIEKTKQSKGKFDFQ